MTRNPFRGHIPFSSVVSLITIVVVVVVVVVTVVMMMAMVIVVMYNVLVEKIILVPASTVQQTKF